MGLAGAIPLLLKEKNVSFEALALFSLVTVPFSLKLLWAPLVDSTYIKALGRRKTWLVPVQITCGILMIIGSYSIDGWMNPSGNQEPDVFTLTVYFVVLYFLMATQDIAVDGWALTMLSKENVGHASTCNSIGQSFGFFLSNQGFIAMSDETWCNRFLGMEMGKTLVDLPQFMVFWGIVFVATTMMIWIFKREDELSPEDTPEGVVDTYKHVVSIFKLRPVQILCMILFTSKIAFSPADSVFSFKLQEYGMPKADIATISPLLLIVGLFLPALVSEKVSKKPIDMFINVGMPLKLVTSALTWLVFQYAVYNYSGKASKAGDDMPHMELFYGTLIIVMVIHEVAGTLVFVSLMSFFNKISDPAIGGTYMTLLNTITNLGSKWPNSTALWLLPKVTWTEGTGKNAITVIDGFTSETIIAIIIGIIWMVLFRRVAQRIQNTPNRDWYVTKNLDNKHM